MLQFLLCPQRFRTQRRPAFPAHQQIVILAGGHSVQDPKPLESSRRMLARCVSGDLVHGIRQCPVLAHKKGHRPHQARGGEPSEADCPHSAPGPTRDIRRSPDFSGWSFILTSGLPTEAAQDGDTCTTDR